MYEAAMAPTAERNTAMSPETAVHQITESMVLVMLLSMPPILVASIVGIGVSLLQALTQVQEQTLSFAIKLIAVAATIAASAAWLGSEMLNYTLKLFNDFPGMT
jgi:type III secretion protein S